MNKKYIYIFFIIVSTFLTSIFFIISIFAQDLAKSSLDKNLINFHKLYVNDLIQNSRNELLNENFRYFDIQMQRLVTSKAICGYEIIHKDIPVISYAINNLQKCVEPNTFELNIFFDQDNKNLWGSVLVTVSSKLRHEFSNEVKYVFIIAFGGIFFFTICFFLYLGNLLSRANVKLFDSIESIMILNISPTVDSVLVRLWNPIISVLTKTVKIQNSK